MKRFTIKVNTRSETGSGPANRLRRAGKVPAVVYGASGSRSIEVDAAEFQTVWKQMIGILAMVELEEEGKKPVLTLVQEIQRDSCTDRFEHIDFRELSDDQPVVARAKVRVVGDPVGVRNEGGIMEKRTRELSIRCLPKHLPEYVEVDVTDLHAGYAIQLKDLTKLEGVEYLGEPRTAIVSCAASRATKALSEAAEAAAK